MEASYQKWGPKAGWLPWEPLLFRYQLSSGQNPAPSDLPTSGRQAISTLSQKEEPGILETVGFKLQNSGPGLILEESG